jgi:exodeoxyribonuclease V beta subunit
VPGCSLSGNACEGLFIRGFIDLVFSWQDRFYFADWKSNHLEDGYHQSAMVREVASAGYELQYQLYSIAVIRWLKYKLGDRFDLHRHFGGAFYIFIRGADSAGQDGIFFVTPEMLLPIASLQANIQKQIGGLQW